MTIQGNQGDAVREFYDRIAEDEDRRIDTYPFEFAITLRYVEKYLPLGSRILDAACGTGRYVEALLAAGHQVGAGDLSKANIQYTERRFQNSHHHSRLLFTRQDNVLNPTAYAGGPWDGILLLGPCYHLPTEEDRRALLRLASSHLSPGGFLYVSYISRLGAFWWGIRHRPEGILEKEGVDRLLHHGTTFNFAAPGKGLPNCYFCDPGSLGADFEEAGLAVRHICGTEGPFGGHVGRYQELMPSVQEAWLSYLVEHCESPAFQWASEHLLVVAQNR